MNKKERDRKIGDMLVADGVITEEQRKEIDNLPEVMDADPK